MNNEQKQYTYCDKGHIGNRHFAWKQLPMKKVDVKLFVSVIADANGTLQDVDITPMSALKQFRDIIPELMKLITVMTKPNIPFDYTLSSDAEDTCDLVKAYSNNTGKYAERFGSNVATFSDTLKKIDSDLFLDNWFLILPEPKCCEIGIRVVERYNALSEEFSQACHAYTQHMEDAYRNVKNADSSAILIAAPTLSAVMANEVTMARFHSKADEYQHKVIAGNAMAIDICIAYQKAMSTELPQILKEGLHEVEQSFIWKCIDIEGVDADKSWWRQLKTSPMATESYVSVLENADGAGGDELRIIADYFEINDAALKKICLTKLRDRVSKKANMSTIGKKDTFFSNVCKYFKMDDGELTAFIYADIIDEIKGKLCTCSRKLPDDAIASITKNRTPHDVAQNCIRAIVSQNDFVALCEIAKEQLLQPLTRAFSINKSGTAKDVYVGIIAYMEKKLVASKKILDETKGQVDELIRRIAEQENALKQAGLFAFSKKKAIAAQINEIKKQIEAAERKCQQKLNEL